MKKIISAVLVGILCVGDLTACGDKRDSERSEKSYGKISDGKYSYIYGHDGEFYNDSVKDLDGAVKHGMDNSEDLHYISFDGKSFEIKYTNSGINSIYSGEYSIKSEAIAFKYDDDFNMQTYSETGSYCKLVIPQMNLNDKFTSYNVLPYIRWHRGISLGITETMTLKSMGDLICTDTYGIDLKDVYKSGEDFTLEYNIMNTLKNDEFSPYNGKKSDFSDENMDSIEKNLLIQYNCDDLNTAFVFSDGEWNWYNADGELINNGKYSESDNYPGLILMYVDTDSKNTNELPSYCMLALYIAEDGNIYYPAFAKVD
ncbi:MAG: hypothetical protein IJY19_08805 [Ruminococcus sp.]|nr:hypothetical protein [Ruminococcus sp.]